MFTSTVSPVNRVGASRSTPYSSASAGLADDVKMTAAVAMDAKTGDGFFQTLLKPWDDPNFDSATAELFCEGFCMLHA